MSPEMVCDRVVAMLRDVKDDPVANVRLTVAKTLGTLKGKFLEDVMKEFVLPTLEKYCADSDRDVQYFGKMALEHLKSYFCLFQTKVSRSVKKWRISFLTCTLRMLSTVLFRMRLKSSLSFVSAMITTDSACLYVFFCIW